MGVSQGGGDSPCLRVLLIYGAIGEYSVSVLVSHVVQLILSLSQLTASRYRDDGFVFGLGSEFPQRKGLQHKPSPR